MARVGVSGPRGIAIGVVVAGLLALSISPGSGRWGGKHVPERLRAAREELRAPFYERPDRSEGRVIRIAIPDLIPGRPHHIAMSFADRIRIWVDGRLVLHASKLPPRRFLWSPHDRLWIGGAPGEPGVSGVWGRAAILDEPISSDHVKVLYAQGPAPPPRVHEGRLYLAVYGSEATTPGLRPQEGVIPVPMTLPPRGEITTWGPHLGGDPAVSAGTLGALARSVSRKGAFSAECWVMPDSGAPSGRRPALAVAQDPTRVSLRLDLGRSDLAVQVWSVFPSPRRMLDLVLNLLAYVPLGFLVGWRRSRARGLVLALQVGGLFSLVVECTQLVIPDRVPSLLDLAANALGALIGALAAPSGSGQDRGSGPTVPL